MTGGKQQTEGTEGAPIVVVERVTDDELAEIAAVKRAVEEKAAALAAASNALHAARGAAEYVRGRIWRAHALGDNDAIRDDGVVVRMRGE